MPLSVGLRLGPYEIQAPLGAGGMGEVYKAVDTRLKRTVAIKVLPPDLAATPDSRHRFQREARSISQLSHPHICTLYDFGQQDSFEFLVMEYLEGETLERRLQRGALPIAQVLTYAIQIASALDKAHHVGIIHRDLKPSNIMLTKEGAKLLDFGLAKVQRTEQSIVGETLTDLTTDQKNLTDKGVILGTFQYMAPEQLEGKEADERTDIFALGAVIYEMVTGKPPFAGKSRASLIAAILASEPVPITKLKTMTPPSLDRVVKVCLAKDADERWQRAHDLNLELKWISETGDAPDRVVSSDRSRNERFVWAGVCIFLLLALLFAFTYHNRSAPLPSVMRFAIQAPEPSGDDPHTVAISPDGQKLALLSRDQEGKSSVWLRSLDSVVAHQLPGTDGSDMPVWSPDSRYLLFVSEGKVRKIDTNGGLPDALCNIKDMAVVSWDGHSTALLSFSLRGSASEMPIQQLGLNDCGMKPATNLDRSHYDVGQQWPRFLPDGEHFLYSGLRSDRKNDVLLASLGGDRAKVLLPNASDAKYVAPGYILFQRNGFLLAQSFNPDTLRLAGEPTQVIPQQLAFGGYSAGANYDASNNGILVYQEASNPVSKLVIRDAKGNDLQTLSDGSWLWAMRVGPDFKRVLFSKLDPQTHTSDLWLFDLQRNNWQRLTFEASSGAHIGVWNPDGRSVVYAATDKAVFRLHRKLLDRAGEPELFGNSDLDRVPTDWSPDGRLLLFTQVDTNGAGDLWAMPMNDLHEPYALTQTRFDERDARFSPDGHWIVYSSDESGKREVYVRSLAAEQERWQVSSKGGQAPEWSRAGHNIYYMTPDWKIMEVPVKIGPSKIDVGTPTLLFAAPRNSYYAALANRTFLILEETYQTNPHVITLNWDIGLKAK